MSNEFPLGDWASTAHQLLTSRTRGLLVVAPISCFALLGWPEIIKRRPEWWTLAAACALQFGMNAIYKNWDGGYCYGPRFLVAICPLLCFGLIPLLEGGVGIRRVLMIATLVVGAESVLLSGLAAMPYWRAYMKSPYDLARETLFPRYTPERQKPLPPTRPFSLEHHAP
jgi:hypothetical protein